MNPGSPLTADTRITQDQVRLSAGRPIRAQAWDLCPNVPPHDHDYHEICLIVAGSGTHVTKAGRSALLPGTVFVVPPAEVHAIEAVQALALINTCYQSEWLMTDLGLVWTEPGAVPLFLSTTLMRSARTDIVELRLSPGEFALIDAELRQIEAEGDLAFPSPLFLRCAFQKAVATMARAWMRADPTSATLAFRAEVWCAMQAIERAVSAGLSYSVAASAAGAGPTVDNFAALFRQSTGYGPTDYFQRRRLHHACQVLLNPRPPVTQVALDLGFSDAPHFCRMFKRYKRMTPTEYRRIYQA